jgi:hypothetical protein
MNLHNNSRQEILYEQRPCKHDFRVIASWSLKKMLKLSILSFQTGVAKGRLLGNYFPPPCLTGPVYHDFLRNLYPQSLQIWVCRLLRLIFGSRIMGAPPHFSSCSSGILEQRVSGTIDKRRWTYRMACSFPWFKILKLLCLGTPKVYFLYYRRPWRETDMTCTTPGILHGVNQSLFKRAVSCVEAEGGPFKHLP